jgi:NAD(P)-dependent dehydrogenase (short-subunit alcohol dehydrogenase family)
MGLDKDRVVVVTGASRGAGKGIAIALGATGATVYVTGRSQREGDAPLPGTVHATAEAVTAAGGRGIAVHCDHADDGQVRQLFEQVREEQGRLDILVNNATSLHDALTDTGPFWEKPLELTDIWNVGMRSHYTATWYAAPLLLAAGGGLVVNTSSFGGRIYGQHFVFRGPDLYARSGLRRRQGRGGQDVPRHGGGLRASQCGCGVHLDGPADDRTHP